MDMSHMPDSSSDSGYGMMTGFQTGLPTSPLWFNSWMPSTVGTTVAACLGLIGLAVLSRLVAAIKHQAERAWKVGIEGTVRLIPDDEDDEDADVSPGMGQRQTGDEEEGGSDVTKSVRDVNPVTTPIKPNNPTTTTPATTTTTRQMMNALVVRRAAAPFMWSQELTRGMLGMIQAAFTYFLMLAVMTFNVYFFISILVGVFIGEVAFGRFAH